MFLIPWFLPERSDVKIIMDSDGDDSCYFNGDLNDLSSKLPDKKDSWVIYDSGIDLTMKDTSSYECTIDDEREMSRLPSRGVANENRFVNFLERYIRMRRRIHVPGNLVNTYAVSSLEVNAEELCVVERVTIV